MSLHDLKTEKSYNTAGTRIQNLGIQMQEQCCPPEKGTDNGTNVHRECEPMNTGRNNAPRIKTF